MLGAGSLLAGFLFDLYRILFLPQLDRRIRLVQPAFFTHAGGYVSMQLYEQKIQTSFRSCATVQRIVAGLGCVGGLGIVRRERMFALTPTSEGQSIHPSPTPPPQFHFFFLAIDTSSLSPIFRKGSTHLFSSGVFSRGRFRISYPPPSFRSNPPLVSLLCLSGAHRSAARLLSMAPRWSVRGFPSLSPTSPNPTHPLPVQPTHPPPPPPLPPHPSPPHPIPPPHRIVLVLVLPFICFGRGDKNTANAARPKNRANKGHGPNQNKKMSFVAFSANTWVRTANDSNNNTNRRHKPY